MSKKSSKSEDDGNVPTDKSLTKKREKYSHLLSTILKKYPFPVKEDQKSKGRIQKGTGNIKQHNFDEDKIGESDGDSFNFEKGFEVLSDILNIYNDYIYGDTYKYISHLTGVNLEEGEDWSSFLEELGISINNIPIEGLPGIYGGAASLTVDSELQGDLLKKLEVIKNRLVAFEEGCGFNEFDPQDHGKVISDLIDVYGTNIPASNLMSLVDYNPPPIGHLTTMLLTNWLKKKTELSYASESYGPLNDYIFLKWLVNGRQKEIMKSLKESITKDNKVAEVYEYFKKLSYQYVNEKMPRFGGPYNSVPISRYKSNKELYSGFYVACPGKSKKKTAVE